MTLRFDDNAIPCRVVCDRCGKEQATTLTVISSGIPRVFDDATCDESTIYARLDVAGLVKIGWRTMLRPDASERIAESRHADLDWLVCPECKDICLREARQRYEKKFKCFGFRATEDKEDKQ